QGVEISGFAVWRVFDAGKAAANFDFTEAEAALATIGSAFPDVLESAIRNQVARMTIDDVLRKRGSIILQLKDEMAYVVGLWGLPWRPSRSRASAFSLGSSLRISRRHSAMPCAWRVNRAPLKRK